VAAEARFRRLDMTFERFLLVAAAVKSLDPEGGFERAIR
jgi:hypothetical protein